VAIFQIRELPTGLEAELSIDQGGAYSLALANPVPPEEEPDLEWYFEKRLLKPFLNTAKAQAIAARIQGYGHALFRQIFADPNALTEYKLALRSEGVDRLRFEIIGSPEFNAWHWECLHDPDLPRPFALDAVLVRKNRKPQTQPAQFRPSPTLNVLLVTARPNGAHDVAYRTISRPLVEMKPGVPVRIDLVRPGTYEALVRHLDDTRERHGVGFYHLIHFDAHGAVLDYASLSEQSENGHLLYQARYGRSDLPAYEGKKGFIFLESGPDNRADPVAAEELANLLMNHQIPLVVLNACQSGQQIGAEDSSLGARLLQAGARQVLAMAYSVTVSAAENLMAELYWHLFQGQDVARALSRGRAELWNRKGRRAYYDQTIDLEDWLLPVLYEDRPLALALCEFTAEKSKHWFDRLGARYTPPPLEYGFVGRDLDVLAIERRILAHNLLLIRGMGGAGKTSLLHHLARWWQATGLVEQVFYFGYDTQAWHCQQIYADIGLKLLGKGRYYAELEPLSLDGQKAKLAHELNRQRHLLILDNLESITGGSLAIPNTLSADEQKNLRAFLAALSGGKTLVLLGSRDAERWLAPGTFGHAVHNLNGLDPESASALAERVLKQHGAMQYREDPDLADLLKLLAGFPLAIQVVLANLAEQTPAQVLAALRAGQVDLDQGDPGDKTQSILACVEYGFGHLAPPQQTLLLCLAPFASVLYQPILENYSQTLSQQAALQDLPFAEWPQVLEAAAKRGLLSRHIEIKGYWNLQPVLPFFLRSRLRMPKLAAMKTAIEQAFRAVYDSFAGELYGLMDSKQPQEKQLGLAFARLEYENLYHALQLALAAQSTILNPYAALSLFIDATHQEQRGLELGELVLQQMENYPAAALQSLLGLELVGVVESIAKRQLSVKRYAEAEAGYRQALSLLENNPAGDARKKRTVAAVLWHQLGTVAQDQWQWPQAEDYYQKALAIFIEFNDRHEQAGTYHELGSVAQEQRQWPQAEDYFQKALAIFIELNDRHRQASTYHRLGMVAQSQWQWSQVENYYQKALAIFIEFNDRHAQAITYHQLGNVAQQQGQWPQAEDFYQKALAIKIEFNNRHSQASTYHQLGLLAESQAQWQQAGDYLLKALARFAEYQDQHFMDIALGNLARLHQTGQTPDLPRRVAEILGWTVEDVAAWFAEFNEPPPGAEG
jgi:tetratricopeptide (TPR) repeat protein